MCGGGHVDPSQSQIRKIELFYNLKVMRLIGFLGASGSGKDTCADYLISKYGSRKMKLADPIKEACRNLFLFDNEQLYGSQRDITDSRYGRTPREIFQYFGTELFRDQMTNYLDIPDSFWIYRFKLAFRVEVETNPDLIVVADVRFQNEVENLKKLGFQIYRITRDGNNLCSSNNHCSESSQSDIPSHLIDGLINNTGSLTSLYKKIDDIVK